MIMLLEIAVALFDKLFANSYRVLDHYLVANFLAFIKGFEMAIFLIVAIIFLIVTANVTMRHARRLPKGYFIHMIDLDGRELALDGLRQRFSTYDAAESYAQLYRKNFANQYRFKVTGLLESIDFTRQD